MEETVELVDGVMEVLIDGTRRLLERGEPVVVAPDAYTPSPTPPTSGRQRSSRW
jgi:hypothetical protein